MFRGRKRIYCVFVETEAGWLNPKHSEIGSYCNGGSDEFQVFSHFSRALKHIVTYCNHKPVKWIVFHAVNKVNNINKINKQRVK